MRKFIINGKFMADSMMGIVRYAREITKSLDLILDELSDITLLLPKNSYDVPKFKNIKIEFYGKHKGIRWEQFDLRRYMKTHSDSICINLCNTVPLFIAPGITTVHDIMYKVNPCYYTALRNRMSRYWHIFQYWYIMRHEKVILTVSEFSRTDIEYHYPHAKGKIRVIPCGWQHVLKYKENPDWEKRYPFLKKDEYYFSLATLSKNKNGKWIIESARYNADSIYAVAGRYYETEAIEIPQNVHMLGFVSDEDACALIHNCKAFIFPSLYEGFGLPPLEALSLGARVISSNATSLPEVLGNSVHYISPKDANVNLEKLLNERLDMSEKTLKRYSWDKSAEKLLDILLQADEK